ncbi:EamA family transporter [Halomicroarcula sp. GCM10025710]
MGASDPLAKTGMERGGTPLQVSLTVVFVSVVVYCAVLLARGVALFSHPYWVLGLFLATGLTATAIARLLSYTGVQRVGASISSATVNTRPVWAMLLAVVFLGELSPHRGPSASGSSSVDSSRWRSRRAATSRGGISATCSSRSPRH